MSNDGGYWQQVQDGDLIALPQSDRHPSPAPAAEPFCTRSQVLYYYTKQLAKVAVVRQYLRQDGTIGASGKPGPKALYVGGVLYSLDEAKARGAE